MSTITPRGLATLIGAEEEEKQFSFVLLYATNFIISFLLGDDMPITLGSSDEDDNRRESEEKNQLKNKCNIPTRKKEDSKISPQKDQNIDAFHSKTPLQSVPSFTDMFGKLY